MTETRGERIRRIRETLEVSLQRAVEIERGRHVLKLIDDAQWHSANAFLCEAMREMALDQYRIRDFDMGKISAAV